MTKKQSDLWVLIALLLPSLTFLGLAIGLGDAVLALTGLALLVVTAEFVGLRHKLTCLYHRMKGHCMGSVIKRTIIVKNDTVRIDIYDDLDDHLCNKVVAGQGLAVRKTKRRVPNLVLDTTDGKHHYVNHCNCGDPVPRDCGTVVVDSSAGPVNVVLPDPSDRNGIKRITVIAVKLAYPISIDSLSDGDVFDSDHIEFGVEGTSYTFAAIKTEKEIGLNLDDAVPAYNPPEGNPQADPSSDVYDQADWPHMPQSDAPVFVNDVKFLGEGWQWYPICRYVPGWVYY